MPIKWKFVSLDLKNIYIIVKNCFATYRILLLYICQVYCKCSVPVLEDRSGVVLCAILVVRRSDLSPIHLKGSYRCLLTTLDLSLMSTFSPTIQGLSQP